MSKEMALHGQYIKGTCQDMCPEKELRMREKEGLLHPLEILKDSEKKDSLPKADKNKVVKKFSRCAAGQPMPKPSDLRSFQALKKTINYLLKEVVLKETCKWNIVYDFIFDRLCAVRQDTVIQDLDVHHSIEILKPIVRFLTYSGYRMCEESIHKYDPVINFSHVTECLRKLLKLYDSCEYPNGDRTECSCERSQFEALYIVTFLGNPDAINRGLMLETDLRTPAVNSALEISIAHFGGNYIRVCRILKDLPPLLSCAAVLHLPTIRRDALHMMSVAFSSPNQQYPTSCLAQDLLFENEANVIDECVYYGINIREENNVVFQKGSFKDHIPLKSLNHQIFIDEVLQTSSVSELMYEYHHYC